MIKIVALSLVLITLGVSLVNELPVLNWCLPLLPLAMLWLAYASEPSKGWQLFVGVMVSLFFYGGLTGNFYEASIFAAGMTLLLYFDFFGRPGILPLLCLVSALLMLEVLSVGAINHPYLIAIFTTRFVILLVTGSLLQQGFRRV